VLHNDKRRSRASAAYRFGASGLGGGGLLERGGAELVKQHCNNTAHRRAPSLDDARSAQVKLRRCEVDEVPDDDAAVEAARAEGARDVLPIELEKLGAIVDETIAYRTVPETEDVSGGIERYRTEGADMVTFTSSSTAENFHALGLPDHDGIRFASIGPVTSKTMQTLKIPVDVEAPVHDIPGLVASILKFYGKP